MKVSVKALWIITATLVSLGLIASAYGGYVNPDVTTIFALLSMMLPGFIVAQIVVCIAGLWISRATSLMGVVALLVSSDSILDYSPINLRHKVVDDQELRDISFTLMSYNVLEFKQYDNQYPDTGTNPTITYILGQDPDIACLIECETIHPYVHRQVLQPQIDSILHRYPYYHIDNRGNSIFSKFPCHQVELKMPDDFNGRIAAYQADIHGKSVTIFVVHMTSIGLSADDRELYDEMTRLHAIDKFGEVRHQLLHKLSIAFRRRAHQARILRQMIDSIDSDNIIVTGDFNDIPGCYALRTIMRDDFKSVYTECGLGPAVTYYGNRFYFRIDHILYRGNLEPLWIKIGDVKYSDHYPLLTQFVIT